MILLLPPNVEKSPELNKKIKTKVAMNGNKNKATAMEKKKRRAYDG
jgi:hypothetical protein